MVCPKCSAVIQEGSNFCPNCGEKCFNMPVDNREQLQPNSDAKKHCRNCNKEIREGTLCKKCLRKLNQEQLTKDERKLRNDNRDKIGCLCACFGLAPIVVGIILMFSISFIVGLIIAGIGVLLFLPWLLTRGSVCPACQRRKTMQRVHSELVGTRDTYVKETRKVYQRRKNGQYKFGTDADYMEYEVDVPATEYFYDVTYQCSKCGHKEIQRESTVQKS